MALEDPGSSGFDSPRDERTRTELFQSVVTGYVESGKSKKLRLMVIGEAGQGKSTLINALVGIEVANEGGRFKAGTNEIKQYKINQNGVYIEIWDTPGFGMDSQEEDEKMVESLKASGCQNVDLALFCVRLDILRFPTRVHQDTIRKLTQVFGRGFWKNCLFVLTFANNIEQLCPPEEEIRLFFSNRCEELEQEIREGLHKHAKLTDVDLATVCAVPVGSYKKGLYRKNPWALPDREDWFIMFWIECTEHMHKSALSALLRANYHRLEAAELSICPPPAFDAHERLLQATTEEVSEIRLQIGNNESDLLLPTQTLQMGGTKHKPDRSTSPLNFQDIQPDISLSLDRSNPPSNIADVEKGIHDREVPLYETLLRQLEDEDSGFFEYISKFAKERGKSLPVLGHLKGFLEGFRAYLTAPRKRKQN